MKDLIILKFGGTSVSRASDNIFSIVKKYSQEYKNVVIVFSAFSGITNLLYRIVDRLNPVKWNLVKLLKQMQKSFYKRIIKSEASLKHLDDLLENIYTQLKENLESLLTTNKDWTENKKKDLIVGYGEKISALVYQQFLIDHELDAFYVPAEDLIKTNSYFQNAFPDMVATNNLIEKNLVPLLKDNSIVITNGFIATDKYNNITTLGRSGSDFSATIIGGCLEPDKIIIYTDVNGILTADPRKIHTAKTINQLNYKQVSELAYFGAKVIHPKTLIPVKEENIPVYVKNTFDLENKGTLIQNNNKKSKHIIDAITSINNHKLITIQGMAMMGVYGVAAKTFLTLNRMNISVPFITQASSEQTICFAVNQENIGKVKYELEKEFKLEIENHMIDKINISNDISIITVVGQNMLRRCGVAGKIFTILGNHSINIQAISQGTSELSISFVVERKLEQIALRIIHTLLEF